MNTMLGANYQECHFLKMYVYLNHKQRIETLINDKQNQYKPNRWSIISEVIIILLTTMLLKFWALAQSGYLH